VNAADFFSNHPFHVRMEGFSRRLWAPAQQGAQRETKWFYERARGQYADAQSKLTPGDQKRFQAEYPKLQMFTKTDLAKFENVWDGYVVSVNYGAQKNFANYAERIGKLWERNPDQFNEFYFRRADCTGNHLSQNRKAGFSSALVQRRLQSKRCSLHDRYAGRGVFKARAGL
jgi:hypothetical protein